MSAHTEAVAKARALQQASKLRKGPGALLKPHTLFRPKTLIECSTVVDIGAGIRPMEWYIPDEHFCVEPYAPYVDRLRAAGYKTIHTTALTFFAVCSRPYEQVLLLDVIEHMAKDDALKVIEWAKRLATKQVVVYTPYGFMEQTTDNWGLGGHFWQTHRSGWLPEEFEGWSVELFRPIPGDVRRQFHNRVPQATLDLYPPEGFTATWEP